MSPERLVLLAIAIAFLGAWALAAVRRNKDVAGWLCFLITVTTAVLVLVAAGRALSGEVSPHGKVLWEIPALGMALRVHVDGLTAVFLVLAAVIAVPASLYSVRYLRRYEGYTASAYYPNVLLFLAAMYGLLSTTDMMWFFFIFWQMMTIPGYLLIRYEHREAEHRRAAMRYMVMMQIACVATMVGAEIVAVTGAKAAGDPSLKYDFQSVSSHMPAMLAEHPALTAAAFALFLIGFGIKMGMWPFGAVWLPEAHPAAPSPVSAMLSGVMIKTGVYGLLRYFLCLVPAEGMADYPLAVWGLLVAILGTITLLTGTGGALRQEYAKRLLAFHSIGQVGYIILAAGVCLTLVDVGTVEARQAAAIALAAALLHSVNHGVFKACLFLNSGSLLHAVNTQNLNRMGGLWRLMPATALTALTASLAISGFPSLNGFVSKWMIYVSALRGSAAAPFLAVCAAMAILTSALTLASFVKFFGSAFLGRASDDVRKAGEKPGSLEVPLSMRVSQSALALICLVTGLLPALLLWLAHAAIRNTPGGLTEMVLLNGAMDRRRTLGMDLAGGFASYAPAALLTVFAGCLLLVWMLGRMGGARRRADEPWLCGYAPPGEATRYTAHSLYSEVKRATTKVRGVDHDGA